jgi:hypothetical protein
MGTCLLVGGAMAGSLGAEQTEVHKRRDTREPMTRPEIRRKPFEFIRGVICKSLKIIGKTASVSIRMAPMSVSVGN